MDSGPSDVETTSAPVLGPTRAFVVFVVFFVVQFGAGLVIGILGGLLYALNHAGQVVASPGSRPDRSGRRSLFTTRTTWVSWS
jgi:hypothetical protein